jgi:hypothetical protein
VEEPTASSTFLIEKARFFAWANVMELNTENLSPNPITAVNDDNDRLCQNLISLLERIEEKVAAQK